MTITRISTLTLSLLAAASFGIAGCEKKEETASEPTKKAEPAEVQTKPAVQAPAPVAAADPGALKTIMAALGDEMTLVQSGLWTDNFELIATSAMKVADHPHVKDEEKQRLIKTLGDDFGAFVALDKVVHGSAVKLSEVATAKDLEGTLKELSVLQTGCVTCHTQFRARLTQTEAK